jgi:hypothetical protein
MQVSDFLVEELSKELAQGDLELAQGEPTDPVSTPFLTFTSDPHRVISLLPS